LISCHVSGCQWHLNKRCADSLMHLTTSIFYCF
jgi:hypothetical protein